MKLNEPLFGDWTKPDKYLLNKRELFQPTTLERSLVEIMRMFAKRIIHASSNSTNYLTVSEACEHFNVSLATLYRLFKKCPKCKVKLPTGGVRVQRNEMEKCLERQRKSVKK